MPKRDLEYMKDQREIISAAALECLLEKGLNATSLRDICLAANVSVGAFYTHFASKDEAVLAACALGYEPLVESPPAHTWQEFVDAFGDLPERLSGPRNLRRFRLSLQIVAETAVDGLAVDFDELYEVLHRAFEATLHELYRKGEASLPLGAEATARVFVRLLSGTTYMAGADRRGDVRSDVGAMLTAMAMIAGRAEANR